MTPTMTMTFVAAAREQPQWSPVAESELQVTSELRTTSSLTGWYAKRMPFWVMSSPTLNLQLTTWAPLIIAKLARGRIRLRRIISYIRASTAQFVHAYAADLCVSVVVNINIRRARVAYLYIALASPTTYQGRHDLPVPVEQRSLLSFLAWVRCAMLFSFWIVFQISVSILLGYYAALLPRRGPHIASHSVCLSVRPSRYRCHR